MYTATYVRRYVEELNTFLHFIKYACMRLFKLEMPSVALNIEILKNDFVVRSRRWNCQ